MATTGIITGADLVEFDSSFETWQKENFPCFFTYKNLEIEKKKLLGTDIAMRD